jgi:hypothetical protein
MSEVKKELTPRELAAIRAKEIRDNNKGDMGEEVDEFFIDADLIPDGWSYEWKRHQLMGMDMDSHFIRLSQMGWEAVPTKRHPQLMPLGTDKKFIVRKGMMLMERPQELTDEVRAIEKQKARERVMTREQQLASVEPGHFERTNKDSSMIKVKRSYAPMEIPDE